MHGWVMKLRSNLVRRMTRLKDRLDACRYSRFAILPKSLWKYSTNAYAWQTLYRNRLEGWIRRSCSRRLKVGLYDMLTWKTQSLRNNNQISKGVLGASDISNGRCPIPLQNATELGQMLHDAPNTMPITRWEFKDAKNYLRKQLTRMCLLLRSDLSRWSLRGLVS